MLTKRIIPCLDVKNGETVKGVNFENLKSAGDPVKLAEKYSNDGADELVFLDITATNEGRKTTVKMVENVAKQVFIPFTVGGGIKSIEDMAASEEMFKKNRENQKTIPFKNDEQAKKPAVRKEAVNKFGHYQRTYDFEELEREFRVN